MSALIDALRKLGEQASPKAHAGPRFWNGRYRDCKWCQGRGCVSCKIEADKEYQRQFPSGPIPIASFDLTDPAAVEQMRKTLGADALRHAFGPDGGGVSEIINNIGVDSCDESA